MKHAMIALAAVSALALAGCSSPASDPEPAPATTTAPAAHEAPESLPAPPPDGRETADMDANNMATEPTPYEPPTEDEAYAAYNQCLASGNDEELCEGALEFDLLDTDEVQDIEDLFNSPEWGCVLDLEKERPDLFPSDDPDVYLSNPEVIEACDL